MGQNNHYCTLTDSELSLKAQEWIDKLIKSGGKDFTMRVPARPNEDTDLVLAELEQRFLKYCHENAALQSKCDRYEKALRIVQKWQLPTTGRFWDGGKTRPMSYGACYGSNGERDFMRNVANEALNGQGEKDCKPDGWPSICDVCGKQDCESDHK